MINLSFLNPLKQTFFVKTILKPISCLSLTSRLYSDVNMDVVGNESISVGKMLTPPEKVKCMMKLDKSAFVKQVHLPAVVFDANNIPEKLKILKKYGLKMWNLKSFIEIESPNEQSVFNRAFLLNPDMIKSFDNFDESDREKLMELNITDSSFRHIERTITFDNWSIESLIKAVLPDNLSFSGYSMIGHIAHFNLKDNLLDYKYVLGEIVLSKVKNVKTVVNKVHVIENTYRNFQMELICGERNMLTKVKENGFTFEMDFEKVYWNPRLATEHERIVRLLNKNDVLYDVFAGIGPFVIPAAKKGCLVVANDLNPDSYKWLNHNVKLNKVLSRVSCFNCDAKDFIETHLRNHLLKIEDLNGTGDYKIHITMNLPACAVDFINSFHGLFTVDESRFISKDIVCHTYCFIKEDNLDKLEDKYLKDCAKTLVETHLRRDLNDSNLVEIVYVRKVAPSKAMFRVSFLFEPDFLIRKSTKRNIDESDIVVSKK